MPKDYLKLADGRLIEVLQTTNEGVKRLDYDSNRFSIWVTPGTGKDRYFLLYDNQSKTTPTKFFSYEKAEDYAMEKEASPIKMSSSRLVDMEEHGEPLWAVGEKNPKGNPNEVFMGNIGPYDIYKSSSGRYAVWLWHPNKRSTAVKIPGQEKTYVPLDSDDETSLMDIFNYISTHTLTESPLSGYKLGVNLEFPGMEIPVHRTTDKPIAKTDYSKALDTFIALAKTEHLEGYEEPDAWRSREPSPLREAQEEESKSAELEELRERAERLSPKYVPTIKKEPEPEYYLTKSGKRTKFKIFSKE